MDSKRLVQRQNSEDPLGVSLSSHQRTDQRIHERKLPETMEKHTKGLKGIRPSTHIELRMVSVNH